MVITKDKNGMTEKEFLDSYDVTQYFRPSVTVDALLYEPTEKGVKLLLIRRGGHPFIGDWAFPGGFVEENEDCESAAARELMEETGITDIPLCQLVTASTPGRDPRWRNITVVFTAKANGINAVGGDDAVDAKVFDISYNRNGNEVMLNFKAEGVESSSTLELSLDDFGNVDLNKTVIKERGNIAFDHAKIVCYLIEKIRGVGK